MISIVCVYNDEEIFNRILLKSLREQNVEYELIAVDNRNNQFKSAAEALNYGGEIAKGDYIIFSHQDMWLCHSRWLQELEQTLKQIPNLGIAGVAGIGTIGSNWKERIRFSILNTNAYDKNWVKPVEFPVEVQTLDECLLIVTKSTFNNLKFDEKVFDGWDCYAADYCLACRELGLKAYVVPGPCIHSCVRAGLRIWEYHGLLKYQKRLYKKYKHKYKTIYTWMGTISAGWLVTYTILQFVWPIFIRLFPDLQSIICKELKNCKSVLDIGCGYHSPIYFCNIHLSVGMDSSYACLQENKREGLHSHYILGRIEEMDFNPETFDAVVAINPMYNRKIINLSDLLIRIKKWKKQKLIIRIINPLNSTLKSLDEINFRDSDIKKLQNMGAKIRGFGGWNRITHKSDVKWLSILTQKVIYFYPHSASEWLIFL